ncbi:type VI secretion system Vgr family protein [Chryseobacterium fistulae]|uniref:Gp5/Type VI secretion system Vgr protein OB-fold domain-containing protein n=1 Tax=Chryseobacterium fistulae TaxID=2675058 RepID=A0A6N4XTN6_9FLAO|nr:phage baseplate assembly protein V [Chryseobacterium fistulae]CAA7386999.1 hypothetical protein CHRY9393_01300 [Chryseobacterium fistulae]
MSTTPKNSRGESFSPVQNAKRISENYHTGINRLVKLSLVIEGKSISHYKHFHLKQYTQQHHQFQVILPNDALGGRETHTLEEVNAFLGKRLTAIISYKDIQDSPERTFVGVITRISFSQEKMSLGNIILSGHSPTILLDGASHIQSFGGDQPVNMGIIAKEVIQQGIDSSRFDIRIDTNDSSQIMYSCQYNETHYNYLTRMAEAYGEQFYYDGEVLHFGKLPQQNTPIQLTYGSSVNDIKIELKAVHTKPQYYSYNSSKNEKLISGTTSIQHTGELAKVAYEHNEKIYKTPSLQVAPIKASTHLDVEYSQKSVSGSASVQVFSVSGNTTIPFLYPGCIADIQMRKGDSNDTSYFTKIMILEAVHDIDTLGHYTGSFEGIASDTGFLPQSDYILPKAEPQLATVVSNVDPEAQGRVQVRFDWQEAEVTHFIRVMSPDAGGTDQVIQNRGYVAIPEVGDQVMVNFVHSHPDRPFVMGGMFHGGIGLGGGLDNRVKSIQTRSGHRIVFTEDESIIITDKSGNEIHLDTTGGNISITAPETMTLNCKNMNINVSENMNTTVGMSKSNTVGMNITQTAGANIWQNATLDYSLNATNIFKIASENYRYEADDIHTSARENIDTVAGKDHIQNSEETIHNLSGEKGHSA